MKKRLLGILLILALGMTACNYDVNTVTDIPALTATAKLTVTPAPTTAPTATAVPTATVAPTATPKPTATPVPTATPKPTATPTPTVTPKPTQAVTQTEKPLSAEVKKLLENAEIYENTDVRGTVCKSEEEANEKVRLNAQTYHSFAVIVEDAGYMHSAGEYMALYPEIEQMSIESVKKYDNGICIRFTDVSIVYDADLCYAIRTGDETMLSGTEKEILTYLNHVIDLTGARSLEKAEAVKAMKLTLRSSQVKMKNGKKAIKLNWKADSDVKFDGIEIYRSLKKNTGYGKKPVYTTVKSSYCNTAVKSGKKYYYKVRGFVRIDGEKVYTRYSTKAWRTAK